MATRRNDTAVPMLAHDVRVGCEVVIAERALLLEEIERRTGSSYRELKEAHHFEYVIPNHDGEDSDNWEAFYHPLGDARRALLAVVAFLRGEGPKGVEKWEKDLLP